MKDKILNFFKILGSNKKLLTIALLIANVSAVFWSNIAVGQKFLNPKTLVPMLIFGITGFFLAFWSRNQNNAPHTNSYSRLWTFMILGIILAPSSLFPFWLQITLLVLSVISLVFLWALMGLASLDKKTTDKKQVQIYKSWIPTLLFPVILLTSVIFGFESSFVSVVFLTFGGYLAFFVIGVISIEDDSFASPINHGHE